MISLLLYTIVHLAEAWLEKVVIDLKNPYISDYDKLNKQEHFRSAVLASLWMAAVIAELVFIERSYYLLPAVLVNRRTFFDFPLSIFRDRPLARYEGNDWWVKRFIWLFGKNGRVIELIVTLAVTIASIILHLIFGKGLIL